MCITSNDWLRTQGAWKTTIHSCNANQVATISTQCRSKPIEWCLPKHCCGSNIRLHTSTVHVWCTYVSSKTMPNGIYTSDAGNTVNSRMASQWPVGTRHTVEPSQYITSGTTKACSLRVRIGTSDYTCITTEHIGLPTCFNHAREGFVELLCCMSKLYQQRRTFWTRFTILTYRKVCHQ